MERIKFGTDGWRGIIANQFTVANVARITHATALWMMNKYNSPQVFIGYDTRFLGKMFAEVSAKIFASKGIRVNLSDDFTTTPMVSLAVRNHGADLGVMITASHNNYSYNGFKLKGSYGGPMMVEDLKNIEDLVSMDNVLDLDLLKWDQFIEQELIRYADLEAGYIEHIQQNFDLAAIRELGPRMAFDAMFGSGQKAFPKLVPGATCIHCSEDPTFAGTPPEPLEKNLGALLELLRKHRKLDIGIAIDGDGDRIALAGKGGRYIDSHMVILILIHCLAGFRKQKGLVVTGYSSTMKVEKLCEHYGLDVVRVPIGFKEICRRMLHEDVLVGGEESGGISIAGYIPERDGIWMALTILQFLKERGKSLEDIMEEIIKITGPFACRRRDIPVPRDQRNRIMDKCSGEGFISFGKMEVVRHEFLDGFKFFFSQDEWVMIRSSGTEPILRAYSEASNPERAEYILDVARKTLLKI
jgi:phosphomannomutase